MSALPAAVLPAASLLRVVPDVQLLLGPAAQTVHIVGDGGRPACGRARAGLQLVDHDDVPPLRVCRSCRASLTDLVRTVLAGIAGPTPAELAAVHEYRARGAAASLYAELERIREDAIFDGSVSELVHLVEAVPNQRGAEHRVETLTFGGHTAAAVPMTLGLLIGELMPGARTNGRVWITDPPEVGSAVALPQGTAATAMATAPPAPGRFPVYTWPQVQQRLAGGGGR